MPFWLHFKGLHLSCKTIMLRNDFSLKHLSTITSNFWTYCGQSLAGLCLFTEVKYKIWRESLMKTLLNIFINIKTEWPNVWAP